MIEIITRDISDVLNSKKGVYNFINMNTVWVIRNVEGYEGLISRMEDFNFVDSRILSWILRVSQTRGPSFTRNFLMGLEAKKEKHFFIGANKEDMKKIVEVCGINVKRILGYNPPYIKCLEFSKKEINKMASLLKKSRPDYVWVCVGSPKQEILANKLYERYKSRYLNVGAAMDFLLDKKRESPKIFTKLGIEWFYRLVTDFKYSRKKVWRSIVAVWLVFSGKVKLRVWR